MAYYTDGILRNPGRPGNTPEGKIWIDPRMDRPGAFVGLDCHVYNYNIDANIPKPEHEAWLKDELAPFVKRVGGHVELTGRASTTGNADYNKSLSLQRLLILKEFLVEECGLTEAQVPGSRMDATGERDANREKGFEEDELDRGVTVQVRPGMLVRSNIRWGQTTVEPRPKRWHEVPADPPPAEREFMAQFTFGFGFSNGFTSWNTSHFEITDLGTLRKRAFVYHGTGINPGIKGPQGGASMGSTETFRFKCKVDGVEDLAGKGASITVFGKQTTMDIPSCGVFQVKVPTGPSMGFGMDTTRGGLIMNSDFRPPDGI